MDWNAAIETNRQALKRVLAMPCGDGRHHRRRGPHRHPAAPSPPDPAPAAAPGGSRSAAAGHRRRARPCRHRCAGAPAQAEASRRSPAGKRPHARPGHGFQLFDPLPRSRRPRRSSRSGVPRICFPGLREPFPDPPPASPQTTGRCAPPRPAPCTALATALDDLPRQARRFARWRGRRDARAQNIRARPRRREKQPPVRPHSPRLAIAPRPPARCAPPADPRNPRHSRNPPWSGSLGDGAARHIMMAREGRKRTDS
jgi:hypothetical protein